MAESSGDTHHPDELRSDLDVLIEMSHRLDRDEEVVHRHLDSLKKKLDSFVHHSTSKSGGGTAG